MYKFTLLRKNLIACKNKKVLELKFFFQKKRKERKKQCKLRGKAHIDNFSSNLLILPIFSPKLGRNPFHPQRVSSMRKLPCPTIFTLLSHLHQPNTFSSIFSSFHKSPHCSLQPISSLSLTGLMSCHSLVPCHHGTTSSSL